MSDSNTIGGFKKFTRTTSRIIDKISVTTGGSIGFSSSFSEEHSLKNYTGAILYWNPETGEIGIQFTTETSEDTVKLNKNPYSEGRTLNARAFFAVNHLTPSSYSGRYEYKVVPFKELDPNDASAGSMYVIKLVKKETHKEQHQNPIVVEPIPQPAPEITPAVVPPTIPGINPVPPIPTSAPTTGEV